MAQPERSVARTEPAVIRTQGVPLLVTGAPGWLCDTLLPLLGAVPAAAAATSAPTARFEIRCLVQSGVTPERLMTWRLNHTEVASSVAGDLRDEAAVRAACADLNGGCVLHAAGIIHPRRTADWYTINRDGTLRLAQAARAAGARRFVYVSSNAAQGASPSPHLLLTEDMPCRPRSHYGQSKYEAEQGLLKLHESGRFEIVIARPCMFYGPPVPQRHVEIFKRIRRGRLPLVGGGQYARSLSYIDDLCAGIILCLTHPNAAGEIFNLCDARVYTTREVCEAMAAALKVPPKFMPLPGFSATVAYGIDRVLASAGIYAMPFHLLSEANWNVGCSSRKATERLGFVPQVDVAEGYRRAVAWCEQQGLL